MNFPRRSLRASASRNHARAAGTLDRISSSFDQDKLSSETKELVRISSGIFRGSHWVAYSLIECERLAQPSILRWSYNAFQRTK
jgi:hypothetical protein